MLEAEISKIRSNEILLLGVRDAEVKKLNEYFMQRIQHQTKEYEEIIAQQQK